MKNDGDFIRDVVAGLKVEYGTPIQLGYRVLGAFDSKLGKQAYTPHQVTIDQAIRLPQQMSFQFLASIGANIKALDIYAGTTQLILDLDDVPAGFDLKAANTWAVRNGRRHDVVHSELYDEAAVLWLKDVGAVEPSNRAAPDRLVFSHQIEVTVT